MENERDEHVALLVSEVGFTPEMAADCTSGDIDRNGAASMLPGIIEALEQVRGAAPFSDDEVIKAAAESASRSTFRGPLRSHLTALKLLARAREAESKAKVLEARLKLAELRELGKPRSEAEVLAWLRAHAPSTLSDADPWPLWCVFETDPRVEASFHGPFATRDAAEAEAAAQRVEADHPDYEIEVRRCRQVRVTDALVRWAAEQLVDHINENTLELADVDGATCYGDWESEIASLREAIDARVEVKLWIIEPVGATP